MKRPEDLFRGTKSQNVIHPNCKLENKEYGMYEFVINRL
jgi:hypothetical protein